MPEKQRSDRDYIVSCDPTQKSQACITKYVLNVQQNKSFFIKTSPNCPLNCDEEKQMHKK